MRTLEWHRVEVGIITGIAISVILIALVLNIMKLAEPECRGPESGICRLPVKDFISNLTVTTESVAGSRFDKLIGWIRMPAMSRTLLLKMGKNVDSIEGTPITSDSEKLLKIVGKMFNSIMMNTEPVQETCQEVHNWFRGVDRSAWYPAKITLNVPCVQSSHHYHREHGNKSHQFPQELARAAKEHRPLWTQHQAPAGL